MIDLTTTLLHGLLICISLYGVCHHQLLDLTKIVAAQYSSGHRSVDVSKNESRKSYQNVCSFAGCTTVCARGYSHLAPAGAMRCF